MTFKLSFWCCIECQYKEGCLYLQCIFLFRNNKNHQYFLVKKHALSGVMLYLHVLARSVTQQQVLAECMREQADLDLHCLLRY